MHFAILQWPVYLYLYAYSLNVYTPWHLEWLCVSSGENTDANYIRQTVRPTSPEVGM